MYLERYHQVKISPSGIWRILHKAGVNRLPASQRYKRRETRWKRYEKQRPGHQLQVDVKFIEPPGQKGRRKRYHGGEAKASRDGARRRVRRPDRDSRRFCELPDRSVRESATRPGVGSRHQFPATPITDAQGFPRRASDRYVPRQPVKRSRAGREQEGGPRPILLGARASRCASSRDVREPPYHHGHRQDGSRSEPLAVVLECGRRWTAFVTQ